MAINGPFIDLSAKPSKFRRIHTIAFANQKGGVGKTTLCASFANLLSKLGYPVLVIDCDNQESIYKMREKDLLVIPEDKLNYHVQKFDITDAATAADLMKRLNDIPAIVIIDCPGAMNQDGIMAVMCGADAMAIPYSYDPVSIRTTLAFTSFFDDSLEKLNIDGPERFFIPNNLQKGWGTKRELDLCENTKAYLETKGKVTPPIYTGAEIKRVNTYANSPKLAELISPAFNFILDDFKGRLVA